MAADEFYYFYNEDKDEEGRKIEPTLECFCKYQAELDEDRLDTVISERIKTAKNKANDHLKTI